MKHPRLFILLIVCIGFSPLLVLASPEAPPAQLVSKYPDLFAWVFGVGLFSMCGLVGFLVHTGNRNNEKQWTKIDDHDHRLTIVETKCDYNHGKASDV